VIFFTILRAFVLLWGSLLVVGVGVSELLVTTPLRHLAARGATGAAAAGSATTAEALANVH
jgi:hypothetical protein